MIKFIKKYFRLLDELIFTAIEDLCGWRNKLVVGSFVLCVMAVMGGNGIIATAAFGAWTIVVTFYFQKRENAEQNEFRNHSNFNDVDAEETNESYEENE